MRLDEEDRLAWGDEQYDRWIDDGHIERKKIMDEWTVALDFYEKYNFDMRKLYVYVRKLEAVAEAAKTHQLDDWKFDGAQGLRTWGNVLGALDALEEKRVGGWNAGDKKNV